MSDLPTFYSGEEIRIDLELHDESGVGNVLGVFAHEGGIDPGGGCCSKDSPVGSKFRCSGALYCLDERDPMGKGSVGQGGV